MPRSYTNQYYIDSTIEIELKPSPGLAGRNYLLIQNNSVDSIYLGFDTHANQHNGLEIPAGQFYERDDSGCPQNKLYLLGAGAAGSAQKILVTEGYND